MPTTFILLRHAEGWDNKAAAIHGPLAYAESAYANASLTATGLEQARGALKDVDMQGIAGIFCSPMQSSYQTLLVADPECKNERVYLDDRLLESQNGLVCHRRATRTHLHMMLPPKWLLDGVSETNPFDKAFSGYPRKDCKCSDIRCLEADDAFAARVVEFTECVRKDYEGYTVLIVAGSQWIDSWLQQYDGAGKLPGYGRSHVSKI